jgi:hypothetical protein
MAAPAYVNKTLVSPFQEYMASTITRGVNNGNTGNQPENSMVLGYVEVS